MLAKNPHNRTLGKIAKGKENKPIERLNGYLSIKL
jgi:hypothetical protein